MKTLISILVIMSIYTHNDAQQVGINVETPTEALDINGTMRLRMVPLSTTPGHVLCIDDTGRVYQTLSDSLHIQNISSNIIQKISGDTILPGDCVAIGDGLTGKLRINTSAFPFTPILITNTNFVAQTFVTGPKTIALKAVIVDIEANGTSPVNTIICSVRTVNAGIPTGQDINNQVAVVSGPSGTGGYFTNGRIVFNPPLSLLPNTQYALVFRTSLSNNNIQLHKQNLGMYSLGYVCTSSNTGTSWQIQTSFDINCQIYLSETEISKVYRSENVSGGSGVIGSNTTQSCLESEGCPSTFFGKNDQYDNAIGIALNNAHQGQYVQIQISGFNQMINTFQVGKKLFIGQPLGKLDIFGTKGVGISTGNGIIIQPDY